MSHSHDSKNRLSNARLLGAVAMLVVMPAAVRAQCDALYLHQIAAFDAEAEDQFGYDAAISGDVAIVGARREDFNCPPEEPNCSSGSAYIYRFNGAVWAFEAKLNASDADMFDSFGFGAAISGDVAVVGAHRNDDGEHCDPGDFNCDSGSAYIFRFDGKTWNEQVKLLPPFDPVPPVGGGDHFGMFVAAHGDLVVISSTGDDDAGQNAGAVYVYRYNGSTWLEEQKLIGSDTDFVDVFGRSVAVQDDLIVVGAYLANAAYVFRYDGNAWSEEAKFTASDGPGVFRFGWSAAVDGDTVVIGATNNGLGKAYVYRYDGVNWVEDAQLTPSEPANDYGISVSVEGELIMVGATADEEAGPQPGAVYVYLDDGESWSEVSRVVGSDPDNFDRFGYAVELSDGRAIVSAFADSSNLSNEGRVYMFSGISDCNGNQELDYCEISLDGKLDQDGDGVLDECQTQCPADLDGNGQVGTSDLLALLAAWGTSPEGPPDFNGDGNVGTSDLLELLANWGRCAK